MHILIASLIDWRTNTLIRWHHHQHQLLYNNITCRSHVALLLFSERLQPGSFLAVHPLFTPQLSCLVLFVSHTDYIPVGIALANDLFALTNKLQYVAQDSLINVNSFLVASLWKELKIKMATLLPHKTELSEVTCRKFQVTLCFI